MGRSFSSFFIAYRYNYIQILVVVILLPFVAIILGISPAADVTGMLSDLAGQIPVCDVWIDLLSKYYGGISVSELFSSAFTVVYRALPESLILSLCVHFCILVSKKLNMRGLPIFATFIGIVIASIVKSLIGLTKNYTYETILDIGTVVLLVVGIGLLSKSLFKGLKVLSLKQVLLFFVNGLFSVLTTAYISGLLLAAQGAYPTVGKAVGVVLILTGIELIVAIGVSWINVLAKKDPDIIS